MGKDLLWYTNSPMYIHVHVHVRDTCTHVHVDPCINEDKPEIFQQEPAPMGIAEFEEELEYETKKADYKLIGSE